MSGGRGVVEKEGGDTKAVGFLWKVFFFIFSLLCVGVHPCFAKHPAALTHFGTFERGYRTSILH